MPLAPSQDTNNDAHLQKCNANVGTTNNASCEEDGWTTQFTDPGLQGKSDS